MELEPTKGMLKIIAEAEEDSDEGFRTAHKLFIDRLRIHIHSTWSRVWGMTIATRANNLDSEINSCFLQWSGTGSGYRTCEISLDKTRSTARL
jgi:hypothetical protein